MCSVDDWLDMYGGGEYDYTEFKCVVIAHPDEIPTNVCDACFGMGPQDTFKDMKYIVIIQWERYFPPVFEPQRRNMTEIKTYEEVYTGKMVFSVSAPTSDVTR